MMTNQISFFKKILTKSNDASEERTRKLSITFLISTVSKGISFLILIVSLPLTLGYLGAERFGVLNTLISTLGIITYSDLGLGMGLQNTLPSLIANEETKNIKRYISTAFFFLLGVACLIFLFSFIIAPFINWGNFFNTKAISGQELQNAIIIYFLVISIGIPASLIQRIQSAYQEGYLAEIWITLGNITSLVSIYFVVQYKGNIPLIILGMQGVVYAFYSLNFLYFTFYKKKYPKPSFAQFDTLILRGLIKLGLSYLFIQICSLFINSIDNLIISRTFGPVKVTDYTVAFRLISILAMPVQLFSVPLLAAYNDAWVRKDKQWISNITLKLLKGAFIGSILGVLLFLFFGNFIVKHWTGNTQYSFYQLLMFGLLLIYLNFNSLISMIGLSSRFIKHLLYIYPIATLITVIVKYLIMQYFSTDYTNIVWATFIPVTIFFFIPILYKIYKEDFSL